MHKLSKINYCYIFITVLLALMATSVLLRLRNQKPIEMTHGPVEIKTIDLSGHDDEPRSQADLMEASAADTSQLAAANAQTLPDEPSPAPEATAVSAALDMPSPFPDRTPNETGKVMVHLFHRFLREYEGGDKTVTMTLDAFRAFLQSTYDKGYRPVSMADYLDNNISLPKGCIPMVITFDDGWASQFQLIEENGEYKVHPDTAVGVWMDFNREHPDFALRAVFYLNLGRPTTFGEVGTLSERLQYLLDLGFELGNHTYEHINLRAASDEEVLYQIGKNQVAYETALPGKKFDTLALPYGNYRPEILSIIASGEYEGVSYAHRAVFLAGAEPSSIASREDFDMSKPIPRILSPGIEPAFMDSDWWLDEENYGLKRQYISDGDPSSISLSDSNEELLSPLASDRWTVKILPESGAAPAEDALSNALPTPENPNENSNAEPTLGPDAVPPASS